MAEDMMTDMMNLDSSEWDESMFDDVLGDIPDFMKLVVFLIDSSGSMEGTVIGSVNSIMEEVLAELETDKGHKRIAVITFGQEVSWVSEDPQTVEEFGGWRRIYGSELSNMGEAFKQLGQKLAVPDWCPQGKNGTTGKFILFSDGLATDRYEDGMKVLKEAQIFNDGERLAVNLSDRIDMDVLKDFAGSEEKVLHLRSNEIGKAEKQILSVIMD